MIGSKRLRRLSRRTSMAVATFCASLSLPVLLVPVHAQINVLEAPTPLSGNQDFGGELGMDFVVNAFAIEVQSLGVFDSMQDGIVEEVGVDRSIHVEIWQRNDGGTPNDPADDTGMGVLASEVFSFGDDGLLMGGSRFKDITPLTLDPGSYSIVAGGFGGLNQHYNTGGEQTNRPQINSAGGNVEFVGSSRFGTASAPGNFPGTPDGGPANRYNAGTFIYTPTVDFDLFLRLEVDRDTGSMTLVNNTPTEVSLLSYAIRSQIGALDPNGWQSISDNYDADAPPPDGGSVDPDDLWVQLTNFANRTDLSEIELGGMGPQNGATLPQGQSIDLGSSPWIKYPGEDVTLTYLLSDGTIVNGLVEFTGTMQTSPFDLGDLNFDGTAYQLDDFIEVMLPNLSSTLPDSLSVAEAYQRGDLNGDLLVDRRDFRDFKNGYLAAGGSATALAAATNVPEPSMIALLVMLGGSMYLWRSNARCNRRGCNWLLACLMAFTTFSAGVPANHSYAQIIALDAPAPLAGNQEFGGELGMDFVVNAFPIEVDSLGVFDSLQDGLMDGDRSIHVEIWERNDGGTPGVPGDDTGVGVLASSLFAFGDDGVLDGGSRFKDVASLTLVPGSYTVVAGGFGGSDQHWNRGTGGTDAQLSTINGAGGIVQFVGGARFGTAFAPGNFPDTADGGPVNRYNAGTFRYTVDVDPLVLEVNTVTGAATILNEGSDTFNVDTYEIVSDTGGPGSLDNTWNGLEGTLGGGWLRGGASDPFSLSEFNLTSSTEFAPGVAYSIGNVFNTVGGAQNLSFKYVTGGAVELDGTIRYVTDAIVDPDFNGDGFVNSADYTVWRDSLGSTGLEPFDQGDADGNGAVNSADYNLWKSQFGMSAGSLVGATTIPEPTSLSLLLLAVAMFAVARRTAQCFRGPAARACCAWVRPACILCSIFIGSTVALAAVTNDRDYQLGDDSGEDAANSPGNVVGDGPSNLAPGSTLDSSGPSGAFLDLAQSGNPLYVDVGSSGLSRPGAGVGDWGVQFDGTDDRLTGTGLNLPDELAGPTSVGAGTPIFADYPFNYDGITARGLQMWVYPDAAALGNGRQGVVFDTVAAGGVSITAGGLWTQVNDGHANDAGIAASVPVVGDQWHHVMHHVYRAGDPGAPAVVPGTGSGELGFTGVVYVNGIAVSANNDTPSPGDLFAGSRTGALVVGAEEIPGDGVVAVFDNYFQGVIDDLEMYVFGDSSGSAGPPPGQNYGTFDLFTDNDWIATEIASTVPGGDLQIGDINRDGAVDSSDVNELVDGWLRQKTLPGAHNSVTVGDWETWAWGDLDHDGFVFLGDAYLLHEALLANGQGGLGMFGFTANANVPEPSLLVMAGLCVLLLIEVRHPFRR